MCILTCIGLVMKHWYIFDFLFVSDSDRCVPLFSKRCDIKLCQKTCERLIVYTLHLSNIYVSLKTSVFIIYFYG